MYQRGHVQKQMLFEPRWSPCLPKTQLSPRITFRILKHNCVVSSCDQVPADVPDVNPCSAREDPWGLGGACVSMSSRGKSALTNQYSLAFLPKEPLLIPGLSLLPLHILMAHPAPMQVTSISSLLLLEAFILKLLQGSEKYVTRFRFFPQSLSAGLGELPLPHGTVDTHLAPAFA